ncbi:MAG: hypothetical protein D3917_13515 [Candidatus Electrothrix sp. AX5]|nr:hypothetical protein [Candidatus Electrothrix sp. AX5]
MEQESYRFIYYGHTNPYKEEQGHNQKQGELDMSSDEPRPQNIRVGQRIKLARCQSWDESFHIFDEESAFAIEMALATGRPLLVRGEPGSGKSQLARAAAQELDRYFIAESITVASEGRDLLWKYDPVARLSEAQTQAAESAMRHQRRISRREGRETQEPIAETLSAQQSDTAKKKKIVSPEKFESFIIS